MSGAGTGLVEGTPIVCRQCGGGMRLEGETAASCPYCGARDELPADEAGRYLDIRNRLNAARTRAAQVKGTEAALARIFEDRRAFWRVSGIYLAVGVIIVAMTSTSLLMNVSPGSAAVPAHLRARVWLAALSGPILAFGLAASFWIALLGGRRHYRRRVRALLLARPIDMGDAAFACRACGGPLTATNDVSVTCRFCSTMNLIPSELHGASSEALRRHATEAARTVSAVHVRVASISTRMEWILGVSVALTFALAYGLPVLAEALLGSGSR